MTEKGRRDFCIECRKETEYLLQKKDIVKNIRDKDYTFAITVAVCAECGEEMSFQALLIRMFRKSMSSTVGGGAGLDVDVPVGAGKQFL